MEEPLINLKIVGPYGENGWQDEDGTEHYNSVAVGPFGAVRNLKIAGEGEDRLILQAPASTLIGIKFAAESDEVYTDAFGTTWLDVIAKNGHVRYQLLEEAVWEDTGQSSQCYLAVLAFSDWTPEVEYVEEPRREIKTVPVEMT